MAAKKRNPDSATKRKVKAIKKLARRTRVPPTKVHDTEKKPRKKPRTVEEILKEEGWK